MIVPVLRRKNSYQLPSFNLARRVFVHVTSITVASATLVRESESDLKICDLPMNGKTVYVDWESILGRPLAEAFEQDEDGWCLFFIKSGIVAHDDVVQDDVDVWNFMTVEWCDEGISRCIEVPLGDHQLNDIADLNRLFLV